MTNNGQELDELLNGIADLFEGMRSELDAVRAQAARLEQENADLRKQNVSLSANTVKSAQTAVPAKPVPSVAVKGAGAPVTGMSSSSFWKVYVNTLGLKEGLQRRYKFYISYLYERRGWQLEDTGHSMIFRKDAKVLVVQSREATGFSVVGNIFIKQLATDALVLKKDNPKLNVGAVFFTTSALSGDAKVMSEKLNVAFNEKLPFTLFPCVKCVKSSGRYYTPYDAGYVRNTGDIFCWTTDEAESKGFTHG